MTAGKKNNKNFLISVADLHCLLQLIRCSEDVVVCCTTLTKLLIDAIVDFNLCLIFD